MTASFSVRLLWYLLHRRRWEKSEKVSVGCHQRRENCSRCLFIIVVSL